MTESVFVDTTEDLQHGQVFGGVRVIDPFASPNLAPPDVLEAVGS